MQTYTHTLLNAFIEKKTASHFAYKFFKRPTKRTKINRRTWTKKHRKVLFCKEKKNLPARHWANSLASALVHHLLACRERACTTLSAYVSIRQHTSAYVSIRTAHFLARRERVSTIHIYINMHVCMYVCMYIRIYMYIYIYIASACPLYTYI